MTPPCTNPEAIHRLKMPSHWGKLAFLSDVHLHAADPATFEAWANAARHLQADALFILGDLFEVWVGDDVLDHPTEGTFWTHCAQVLLEVTRRMPVYFMPGNRDFLVGPELLSRTGMEALPDPTLLEWPQTRWLLTHGDLLCTDDHAYQAFRQQVRTPQWQHAFLTRTLEERLHLARKMRDESTTRQSTKAAAWTDVNAHTVAQWMFTFDAPVLVHGHTHQPAWHALPNHRSRLVLSDWDANAAPPRLQWLEASTSHPGAETPTFRIKTCLTA